MKRAAFIILLVLMLMPGCKKHEAPAPSSIDTIPQMMSQIRRCSKLELTQYKVHVIAKYEDKGSKLEGSIFGMDYNVKLPTGSRKIAIPIDATVHAYIDFSDFSEQQVDYIDDNIIITLPDPTIEILHTKVSNKDIVSAVSFLRRDFTDTEITHFQRMGRDSIEANVRNMQFTERARKQAAATLIPMIKQLGFDESQIQIRFRDNLRDESLQFLYKIEEP
jgi:hypothetical protein